MNVIIPLPLPSQSECQDILTPAFISTLVIGATPSLSVQSCFALSKVKSATPVFFVWPVVTDTYSNAAGSVTSVDLILSPQNRREKREREQAWKGGKVAFTSQSVSLKNKNKRNLSATF